VNATICLFWRGSFALAAEHRGDPPERHRGDPPEHARHRGDPPERAHAKRRKAEHTDVDSSLDIWGRDALRNWFNVEVHAVRNGGPGVADDPASPPPPLDGRGKHARHRGDPPESAQAKRRKAEHTDDDSSLDIWGRDALRNWFNVEAHAVRNGGPGAASASASASTSSAASADDPAGVSMPICPWMLVADMAGWMGAAAVPYV
jgi:hypothetical protein